MTNIRELYQEVILDHNKNPRNFGKIEHHTHHAVGNNPLCGDHFDVMLVVDNDVIVDVHFNGAGCAISKASASIMTEELIGKSVSEAEKMFETFQSLVTSDVDEEVDFDKLGKIAIFAGVREFPARVKCASLAWRTMSAALENKSEAISTED